MKLYFLRHGKADWPTWDKPDDERPLTKAGRAEMCRIARFLCCQGVKPVRIVSSPLPRALQTAELAAKALKMDVEQDPLLKPGFNSKKLLAIIGRGKSGDLMLVGHEPDFSEIISSLTGGEIALKKGGVARVDLDNQTTTSGTLVWLIPPKIAGA